MGCHGHGDTLIREVFGGSILNKEHSENMLDLQLPITNGAVCFCDFLKDYTEAEILDYRCEKCGTNGKKTTHSIQLDQLPRILTFHLKRVHGQQKITGKLTLPLELNLAEFTVTQNVKCVYNLYAFVVHKGTVESGHYYSYIRVSATDWYKFNDERIKRVDVDRVRVQEPYIIFYAKEGTPWFSEATQGHKASTSSQPAGETSKRMNSSSTSSSTSSQPPGPALRAGGHGRRPRAPKN
ncbi:ubiquitin carboxyl-terminal hydrolase 20-like isoform X2 [Salvia miltiorrhiza]|uniref:ubiquitin carboxyl-terminal hydrolase 20-like isoform X2 n=1 Tax=Salvia miltiorrhiza TaxID=226208 RepID=UPI0025ACFA4F|nr:ubiquitin carboxyl-terminal hydrolase 20-like isoform X2 [Salvia miltiorrhiza]